MMKSRGEMMMHNQCFIHGCGAAGSWRGGIPTAPRTGTTSAAILLHTRVCRSLRVFCDHA